VELVLNRTCHNEFGTFGTLRIGDVLLHTVEQDWENNQPNVSCIPNGVYELRYFDSPKHGDSYIISNHELNVGRFQGEATRFGCLIHKANLASQLQGCIAPGLGLGFYKGQWSVTSSTSAMSAILEILGKEGSHSLVVGSMFPSFKES